MNGLMYWFIQLYHVSCNLRSFSYYVMLKFLFLNHLSSVLRCVSPLSLMTPSVLLYVKKLTYQSAIMRSISDK